MVDFLKVIAPLPKEPSNSISCYPVRVTRAVGLLLWLICFICLSPAAFAQEPNKNNESCLRCHGDASISSMRPEALVGMVRISEGQQPVLRAPEKIPALYMSAEEFNKSAHRGIACTDCHLGADSLPHDQRLAVMQCVDCHANAQKEIAKGPHGAASKSGRAKPTCADCHGSPHEVPRRDNPRPHGSAEAIVAACSKCHDQKGPYEFNPVTSYKDNVHARGLFKTGLTVSATCADCHGHHSVLPSTNPESPLSPLNTPKTCGKCHEGVEDTFLSSVHGQNLLKGNKNAASCTNCHRSHGIHEISAPYLADFVEECSNCHLELGKSYLASYHGKAVQLSDYSSAVCSSCHGAHDILPKSDPRSRVAPANLQKTCGECHKNATKNFTKFIAHMDIFDRKGQPVVFYTWAIMTTLLVSVLLFFIPHTLLYFQRSLVQHIKHNGIALAKPPKNERMIMRFAPIHRFTHALIVISFMGLVATGFPLKYSYSGWAQNITAFMGGVQTMGLLHRILAVITFAYAGVHALYLVYFFFKHRPRPILKFLFGPHSMILNFKDLKDFFAMVRWFFWLGPRPRFDRWTYFEKFDYWGEIWGVFVIGGTGLMLWVPTLFTRWLPGWVLNMATVIHSIEALLAASVIFLVHFVNTHLRPEKFPIDMVMLTGHMPESELEEERPEEYERLKETGELEKLVVPQMDFHWRLFGAILGIIAFVTGLALIALAMITEIRHFL